MNDRSITPKDRPMLDPLDAMIEALSQLSVAVRESSREVQASLGKIVESHNVLAGRLDGQSRAAQELASEIRSFVDSKERMHGRIVMLELLEKERREANGKDAE
jgi:methyl-accepting chemotaxis protein